eukprot:Selendium_serpulae@DN6351_c0_g4_i3.p1
MAAFPEYRKLRVLERRSQTESSAVSMRGLSKQQQPLRDEDADVCDTSSASCVSPAALLDAVGANLVCVSKSDGRVNVARTRELQPRAASSASATKSKTAKQRPDGRRESEIRFCDERNVPRRPLPTHTYDADDDKTSVLSEQVRQRNLFSKSFTFNSSFVLSSNTTHIMLRL